MTAVSRIPRHRPADRLTALARLALYLTIITLPWRQRLVLAARPSPPVYPDFTDLLLYTHQVFLLALLFLWGGSLALRPRRLHTGPFFLWGPLLGLTLVVAVSGVTAVDPWLGGYHAGHFILLALLYLFVVNEVNGWGGAATAVAVQIGVQAAVGIGQAWRQSDLGLGWLGERMLDPAAGASTVWAQGGLRSLRAYGLSDHPNILAAGLVFGLLLLAAWYLAANGRWRAMAAAVFGLGSVALFLSFSRPAWIGLVLGVGGTVVFRRQIQSALRPRRWLPAAGLSLLLLLPTVGVWRPYLQFGAEVDVIAARVEERLYMRQQRITLTQAANEQFTQHALLGVGPGNLPLALQDAGPLPYDYQPARVSLITAAAESGLFGAMFYLLALAVPWLTLLWRRDLLRADPTLAGLYGLLLAMLLFSFYDPYLWFHPAGRLWQWLAWALWAAAFGQSITRSTYA